MPRELRNLPNTTLIKGDPNADRTWRKALEEGWTRLIEPGQIDHNTLDSLQGGTTDQYYHLTQAQHTIANAALASQSANTVFSGPTTGAAAAPTFRALVAADIPAAARGNLYFSAVHG